MTIPMYDLFISYSSHDRPWAERVYNDLGQSFRSINIFWDVWLYPQEAIGEPLTNATGERQAFARLVVGCCPRFHQRSIQR